MRFSIAVVAFLSMLAHAVPAFAQAVAETEPNNSPATANSGVLGGAVTGHVGFGESESDDSVDYWVLHAVAGDTINIAASVCPSCVDSQVWMYLLAPDGVTTLVHGSHFDGNDLQLQYVAGTTGQYFVRLVGSRGGSPPYTLRFVERKCPVDPGEPNQTRETARSITLGSAISARWCPYGDRDFYKIQLDAGTILEYSLDRFTPGDYYDHDDYGSPGVHLMGPGGELLDSLVTRDLGPLRFTVPRTGTYYLQPFRARGGMTPVYELSVRAAGQVLPGPGDPPNVLVDARAAAMWFSYLTVDKHGDFWAFPGANDPLVRVSLDGTITKFNEPDLGWIPAWDPWGNLLTAHYLGITKFAPPHRTKRIITFERPGSNGMAVASDGIWILGPTWLEKYSFEGQLVETHQLSHQLPPIALKLGPSGDPYFASGKQIYRFAGGRAELVLLHEGSSLSGFAFDDLGNIYVTDRGFWWPDTVHGKARVSLHDRNGALVADSFAWWPNEPHSPTFGRNPDGTTNSRLFIVDDGRLLELNRTGVRAPGRPVQPTGTCPVHPSEEEPNDTPASAHGLVLDTTVTGVSCMAGDEDFFQFTATRTQQLGLKVEGADQPTLEILAADGQTRLAFSDTPASGPRITHAVEAGKTYFVRVGSWFGGPTPYTLQVGSTLARPEGLTVERAARELSRPNAILNSAERAYLDQLGNNNGRYDVGDFSAYYRREHPSP